MALITALSAGAGAAAVLGVSGAAHLGALRAAAAEGGAAIPGQALQGALRTDAVPKASDGHYWAEGDVDGRRVKFLVDTGATVVALTAQDARRLGIDTDRLRFGSSVVTAAGRARAASVRLASVTVAGARLENVDALVIDKGLDASLLGMSYLGRLSSFQATRQALFLRP